MKPIFFASGDLWKIQLPSSSDLLELQDTTSEISVHSPETSKKQLGKKPLGSKKASNLTPVSLEENHREGLLTKTFFNLILLGIKRLKFKKTLSRKDRNSYFTFLFYSFVIFY